MKVLRPALFSRKCPFCKAVVSLENSEMNFKGNTSKLCPNCDHAVFFTNSFGLLDECVLVEYGLVPEVIARGTK